MCRVSSRHERRAIRTEVRQNSRLQLYVESRLKGLRTDLTEAGKRFCYLCEDFAEARGKANAKEVIENLIKRLKGMMTGLSTFNRGAKQLRIEAAGLSTEDYSADFDNLLDQSDDLHREMLIIKDELVARKADADNEQ